jgi:hypothetical protein
MSEDATAEEMMAAKEAAMNSDECTRSRVSALESGASWYGTLHVGINSAGTAGVVDGGSNWGIKGSSEVSEGLTAVYRFEHKISTENASQPGGRLAYVGLTGGFGSLTIGQIWSASYNSFGAITDNSGFIGDSETTGRHGSVVSYAVSVENISLQLDATMNNGSGAKAGTTAEDKNVDAAELGVSMGLGESGKMAFAYKNHDSMVGTSKKSNYIAAEYSIGAMTAYLGYAQHKTKNNEATARGKIALAEGAVFLNDGIGSAVRDDGSTYDAAEDTLVTAAVDAVTKSTVNQTDKTLFAGVRGSVGDTGVSYVLQVRTKKSKGNEAYDAATASDGNNAIGTAEANLRSLSVANSTPWMFGLNRSLGGGASVHFEHSDPDVAGKKSTSWLALSVSF